MKRPTSEELSKLFEPEGVKVGVLRWAVSPARNVKVGDIAGSVRHDHRTRYRVVTINGKHCPAHIIVWAMTHGRWPAPGMVIAHHPDNDGLNNLPNNLVEQSIGINSQEQRHRVEGTSIYHGVSWNKRDRAWRSTIMFNKCHIHIITTDDELFAARAYDTAAVLAFGEWANTNAKVHGWAYEPVELSERVAAAINRERILSTNEEAHELWRDWAFDTRAGAA